MQKDSLYTRFLAGAVASSAAEMVTLPVDISKVRLQAQGMHVLRTHPQQPISNSAGSSNVRSYTGMFDAIYTIAREEGVAALWKGARPAVTRQIVYSSTCMVLYEPFRDAMLFMTSTRPDQQSMGTHMSFAQKLMAGGMAGALSIGIANPYVSIY